VAEKDGEKFVIFNVAEPFPEMGFAQKPEMGNQLAEPDVTR